MIDDSLDAFFNALPPSEGDGTVDLGETSEPDEYRGETRDPLPADDGLICEDCGNSIVWAGRGRKPKRCVDCRGKKSTTRTGTSTTPRARGSRRDARLESIETRLHSSAVKLGMVMGRYAPVTGLVFVDRSDRFTSAAVRLAADRPRVLDVLEKIADTEPVFEIAEFLASVVFAVGIDVGRVHPGSFAAQILGLTQLWEEYNKQPAIREEQPTDYQDAGVHVPVRAPTFGPGPLPTFSPIGEGV